jgi:phosphoribosyl 1,2-cyclic phosphate phosphodiesterase
MKLLFLGTAAAEGWPALFCRCEDCQRARELGGKNIRTRISLQLGSQYKSDFPPDSYFQMLKYDLSYADLKHLFITHTHQDHLYALDFRMRAAPFVLSGLEELHVYGSEAVYQEITERVEALDKCKLVLRVVKPFESLQSSMTKLCFRALTPAGIRSRPGRSWPIIAST